jgi:Icc protein
MRLAWTTDLHLEFLDARGRRTFLDRLAEEGADAVLVGGDTSQAATLTPTLSAMAERIGKPIWFVLGNHDFYGGSISDVRARAAALSRGGRAVWLGATDVVELTAQTALVGHDGWGDARLGDFAGSDVVLNDFFAIAELVQRDRESLGRVLRALGDESAAHLGRVLPRALEGHEHVIVLTHVPPFREAAWHEGRPSNDAFLPFFACQATGQAILEAASRYPDSRLTVLCGHTHSGGECQPRPNLRVITGPAKYGHPAIQEPLIEAR